MDVNLGSGWLIGNVLEHLGWLLLLVAAASRTVRWLRVLLLLAGLAWFLHELLFAGDWVRGAWAAALVVVAAGGLTRFLVAERSIRFNAEEQEMVSGMFPGLARSAARHLLDQGLWLTAREGDVLTRTGEPLSHLYYLHTGHAKVVSEGKAIAECPAGSFIGEVTVLSGEPATVTVQIDAASRLWCVPAAVLRRYADEHDDVRRALESAFRRSLTDKLMASNRRAVERV